MFFSTETIDLYWIIPVSLVCILGSVLVKKIRRAYQFRQFAAKNKCVPVNEDEQSESILGLGRLLRMIQTYRRGCFLEWWRETAERLGSTFSFWLLGQQFFVTLDPENVKTVFTTSFDTFEHGPQRKAAGKPLIGNGIFAADGAEWHAARALLRPSFSKSQIHDLDMLERHFQTFLEVLPADGVVVDLQELFKSLSMDVITDMLFGSSMESLKENDNEEAVAFSKASEYAQKVAWRNISLGWVGPLLPDIKDWRARRLLHSTVDRIVKQVLLNNPEKPLAHSVDKEKGKQYVFLEHLVERTRDPRVLRDQLMSGLLGGRDTTSSLLSNLFHVLARNPNIWETLRAEVRQIGSQTPTMEDIQRAKYARNCIQESLRLHPVVPINQRWAKADTILPCGDGSGPVAIPQGSNVYIAVYSMHRRKDIYGQDADVFRPERWDTLRPGWAFVPFGGGPRLCIGQEFALTEAMYYLIRMVQAFDEIRPIDYRPWRENVSITLNSAGGCKVFLSRTGSK